MGLWPQLSGLGVPSYKKRVWSFTRSVFLADLFSRTERSNQDLRSHSDKMSHFKTPQKAGVIHVFM